MREHGPTNFNLSANITENQFVTLKLAKIYLQQYKKGYTLNETNRCNRKKFMCDNNTSNNLLCNGNLASL